MRLLFLFIILLIAVNVFCQSPTVEVKKSGEKAFRVVVTDQKTGQQIMEKFSGKEMTRFSGVKKKDRNGEYWEVSYYFKNEDADSVLPFVKGLK